MAYRDLLVCFYKWGHFEFEKECRNYKTLLLKLLDRSLGPAPAENESSVSHDQYWNLMAAKARFLVKLSNDRRPTIRKMSFLALPLRFNQWPEMPKCVYHPLLHMLQEAMSDKKADHFMNMFCFM